MGGCARQQLESSQRTPADSAGPPPACDRRWSANLFCTHSPISWNSSALGTCPSVAQPVVGLAEEPARNPFLLGAYAFGAYVSFPSSTSYNFGAVVWCPVR